MAKFIGRRVRVGVGRETSRGAGVAPSQWIPVESLTFDDRVVKPRSVAGLGRIEDSDEAFVTTKYAEGDFSGEVRDQTFGYLLYSLLGTISTSGPADEAYTHTFSIEQGSQHESLALTVVDSNTTEMYRLAMINSLDLTVDLDEVVKYSAGVMSRTACSATATASYTDENKFTKKHLAFKVAAARGDLAAASAVSLKSLSLSINQNVMMDDVLGTAEPEDFLNQQFSVEGELTLNYEDATWKNYMLNGTERAMSIALTNTDATIGAGSTNPSLTFTFPKVDFYDWTPNYALDEIVSQTISFKANYDVANSEAGIYSVVLVNGKTSY